MRQIFSNARGLALSLICVIGVHFFANGAFATSPDFEKEIAPILLSSCVSCHSGSSPTGGLDLTTRAGLLKGGESGPAWGPDQADESLIWEKVSSGEMPPPKQNRSQKLPADQLELLNQWLKAGATWPADRKLDLFERTTASRAGRDWWSLQPIKKVDLPNLPEFSNPIDRFLASALQKQGRTFAPLADKRTMIRRLSIDLIGLPPTYQEIEAYVQDQAPDAYEKLVDRFLASEHFGERWARRWLDVVRYAETCGYERDQVKENVWRYRDWVVQAINEDKPYNRFIQEQLAGDELPNSTESQWIATGFLRLGTWNDEPNDPNEYLYERLEDMVHATSSAFLGMTVKCARCHDHKFDPIRQTDYYRMASAFWAGPIQPGSRDHLGGPDPNQLPFSNVHAWTDNNANPSPLRLLIKGDPKRPGPEVAFGHLSSISSLERPEIKPSAGAKTTGRRKQIADWITDPQHPLTARVWVNRVWQGHFGEGLVRTVDDFGFNSDKPTHPELLDWLAQNLIGQGWKTKTLHKRIVMSQAYRQSSLHPRQVQYEQTDYANRYYWRFDRKRLDAETLRDALLLVSGQLDRKVGGPSFRPEIDPEALEGLSTKDKAWTPSPPEERNRRSLYIHTKRGLLPPILTVFDFPDTTLPCGRRESTIVPSQALALWNNSFVHQQSSWLAAQVRKKTENPVVGVWKQALGRLPTAKEIELAKVHMERQIQRFQAEKASPDQAKVKAFESLCHVLVNSNEFLYVD